MIRQPPSTPVESYRSYSELRNEQFKMSVMAGAKISAYIFNTQFGSLSGPFALDILILRNFC